MSLLDKAGSNDLSQNFGKYSSISKFLLKFSNMFIFKLLSQDWLQGFERLITCLEGAKDYF